MATTPMAGTGDLPAATTLAVERTRLAHERTLMAWVRTATSLISFGFTVYKFFEYLRHEQPATPQAIIGPREFALMMIGTGLAALVLATIGHRRAIENLRREYGPLVISSLATDVAALIGVLGTLLLVAVLFRI